MILLLVVSLYLWRLYVNRNPYEGMTEEQIFKIIYATPFGKRMMETVCYMVLREQD